MCVKNYVSYKDLSSVFILYDQLLSLLFIQSNFTLTTLRNMWNLKDGT